MPVRKSSYLRIQESILQAQKANKLNKVIEVEKRKVYFTANFPVQKSKYRAAKKQLEKLEKENNNIGFHTIGDVSEKTGVKSYILRYWEKEFQFLQPIKNKAGHRLYTDRDIYIINKIKEIRNKMSHFESVEFELFNDLVKYMKKEELRHLFY